MKLSMNKKLIYIILDGAADRVEKGTSIETAYTPNLDEISKNGRGGMHYPAGRGIAPESDIAVFNLLGYNHEKYYFSRGPVEVLGVDLELKEKCEIALRGNLATADYDKGVIIDRRVGRDITTEEATQLIKEIENIDLGIYGGYAKVKVGLDYRLAIIIGSTEYGLSDKISNTDPAYIKHGNISIAAGGGEMRIMKCKPLSNEYTSRITAELINKFIEISSETLNKHRINKLRVKKGKLPANIILLRDAGLKPMGIPSFYEIYGYTLTILAEMPTEIGIAKLIQAKVVRCPKAGMDHSQYQSRVDDVINALEKTDIIYIHIKGPDMYGHDGNKDGKIENIELIDKYFIGKLYDKLDINRYSILITMDHPTPPSERRHTDDPVPFIIFSDGIGCDKIVKFSELEIYKKGSLGILGYGWMIMPIILKLLDK